VPTAVKGYEKLLRWAQDFGPVRSAGVEGTSSYGDGLTCHLRATGISVVEVERPKRRHLRRNGKSDPIDAEAARAVLAGEAVGEPKSADRRVELIRDLRSARHHRRLRPHAGICRKAHRWRSLARASERSSAASSATSPGRPTAC